MNPLISLGVRHFLGIVAGIAVHKGIVDQQTADHLKDQATGPATDFAIAAAAAAGAIGWSMADKVKNSIFGLFGKPKTPAQVNQAIVAKVNK